VVEAIGVMTRLRDETADDHKRAETGPLERALVSGHLRQPQFVEYLAQRWLIHRELERHIGTLCGTDARLTNLVPDVLRQESNVRADLAHFGRDVESIQPRRATGGFLSHVENIARVRPVALLGCYYVLEGSENGARYIARAVIGAYRLTPGQGTRYLDPHGEEQRPLWAAFKQRMDAVGFDDDEIDAMVAEARQMFAAIRELDDEIWSDGALSAPTGAA
jgi:heme oxygenase